MKKFILLLSFTLLCTLLYSQCNNGSNYYPSSIYTPSPNSWGAASTCNWAGEVIRVSIISGDTYQFSTCGNYGSITAGYDTQLTLRNENGAVVAFNDDYFGCTGYTSYINWTATYTGTLYIHLNQYPCTSNNSCTRVQIYRTEQQLVSGPCTNTAYYTTRNFPTQQTGTESIACYYAGDYCQINNPEQGVAYTVSSTTSGDWITVRKGTYDGNVDATGFGSAIIQSAEAGQTYFIHVNIDDFCVVESSCRDVVITRQSALPITLSYFDAYYLDNIENNVHIEWETHSEQNNDYFTIFKSYDGYEWKELKRVEGSGNSNSKLFYRSEDENPRDGVQYYKLRQTDYDGNWEEFEIKSVVIKSERKEVVKTYDQMGREVNHNYRGFVIQVWDNLEITKTINK
jgi:hypothetical protein